MKTKSLSNERGSCVRICAARDGSGTIRARPFLVLVVVVMVPRLISIWGPAQAEKLFASQARIDGKNDSFAAPGPFAGLPPILRA